MERKFITCGFLHEFRRQEDFEFCKIWSFQIFEYLYISTVSNMTNSNSSASFIQRQYSGFVRIDINECKLMDFDYSSENWGSGSFNVLYGKYPAVTW